MSNTAVEEQNYNMISLQHIVAIIHLQALSWMCALCLASSFIFFLNRTL